MVAPTDYPRPTPPNPTPGIDPQPPGAKPKPTNTAPPPQQATTPKPPDATVIAKKLAAGQDLKAGEAIRSDNGQYELQMQKDGNLVLYDVANGKSLWSSNTSGSGAQVARLGKDGNLQVLNGDRAVWSSNTAGRSDVTLIPQDDGNLVLSAKTATVGAPPADVPVWSSKTEALPIAVAGQNGATQQQAIPTQPTPAATFGPGLPELGLQNFTIHCPESSTGSAWTIFEDNGVKGLPGTLNDNLAATPYLDRKAFGTRAANPQDAVYKIPNGQQVTILDKNRLAYLEQERTQIADVEHASNPDDKDKKTVALANTIEDELDYAGTQQALPDPDALAQSLSARAPGDKDFQTAVQAGVVLYKARLTAEGRTADQFGAIQKAAASGDWASVRKLTAQQIAAGADGTTGSTALGKMLAKGGVYLTFATGDPKFAQNVRAGIADAQQQVLLDNPIGQVQAAYQKGGGAAAMAALNKITDPQTALPGQVAQIMSDPRIQGVVKDSLDKANWSDSSAKQMMSDLGAACQHAIEADQGERGNGAKAVDAIAKQVLTVTGKINDTPHLMDDPQPATQLFKNLASQGNVSLGLAVAAQATQQGDDGDAASAIDGTRAGIDVFSADTKSLNEKTAKDAAFLAVPLHDFGGNSTPAEQSAYVQKLLADNPSEAKTLNDDGVKLATQQEQLDGMKMALASYSPSLNGVEGFNTPVGRERTQNPTLQTPSKSVMSAFDSTPAVGNQKDAPANSYTSNKSPTNYYWLMRSTRNVAYQSMVAFVATDPSKLPAAFQKFSINNHIPDGLKSKLFAQDAKGLSSGFVNGGLVDRANKLLSSTLFMRNGMTVMEGFNVEPHNAAAWIEDGSYAYQHEVVGLTQGASALLPQNLSKIRPGSGATVIKGIFDASKSKILDAQGLSDPMKRLFTGVAGAALRDTMDVAYLGIDATNMVEYAKNASSIADYERSVGEGISAAGDLSFLMGAATGATSEAEVGALGADTILGLGEGAVGWTGVGAVLMLVGSGVYTIGSAEAHSHTYDKYDKQMLEAMGVHSDVAEQLAKHAFTFSGDAPTAGPFLAEYFKNAHVTNKDMVAWLNSMTPSQADSMASELKSIDGLWQKHPMSELGPQFDNWLLAHQIMPPVQLVANNN
ncbi:hypothetical protein [Trinickia sp.]|uniref:hypothetical protein n=1 Tax=Trinickia sp. TaxID=2571163 RepID=UPI003F81B7F3